MKCREGAKPIIRDNQIHILWSEIKERFERKYPGLVLSTQDKKLIDPKITLIVDSQQPLFEQCLYIIHKKNDIINFVIGILDGCVVTTPRLWRKSIVTLEMGRFSDDVGWSSIPTITTEELESYKQNIDLLLTGNSRHECLLRVNLFEAFPDSLPILDRNIELREKLYNKLGFEHKTSLLKNGIKLGVTSMFDLDVYSILTRCNVFRSIKAYAKIGKWGTADEINGVSYHTQEGTLTKLFSEYHIRTGEPEVLILLVARSFCFYAINIAVLEGGNPICSIIFAQENKNIIWFVVKSHPEYFVNMLVIQGVLDSNMYFTLFNKLPNTKLLDARAKILEPFILKGGNNVHVLELIKTLKEKRNFKEQDLEEDEILSRSEACDSAITTLKEKINDREYILKGIPKVYQQIEQIVEIVKIIYLHYVESSIGGLVSFQHADCPALKSLRIVKEIMISKSEEKKESAPQDKKPVPQVKSDEGKRLERKDSDSWYDDGSEGDGEGDSDSELLGDVALD